MQVAVVTANEADAALAAGFLDGPQVRTIHCAGVAQLGEALGPEIGCVVLVEEALLDADVPALQAALDAQPPWSDLPLVLIASRDSTMPALVDQYFPMLGNVTLLHRPLHPLTLVSAVNTAMRSRQRQYQVRDLLEERARALKQRDEFLAMLAHELRNPLAPIRNAAYILRNMDVPDPDFEKCRTMIEKQAKHITRLVDDLLDASRLELGKVALQLQEVDLNQAAASAIEASATMTRRHRHHIEVKLTPEPLVISGDPVRIEQVFGNLIVNAAKFTPEGGTITIETRREGGQGIVSVSDTGRGISPDMLGAVFDLFVQEKATLARSEGGLGIGLTLVKRLVEMHGGTVAVESAGLNQGARFETRFPLVAADVAAARQPERAQTAAAKRVLIVEDRDDTRESLGMLLSQWRHDVAYASDGLGGVARAHELLPDVAIIDIGLPGIDGYEVARRIREGPLPWARRVKLLALTGYGQPEDRERAEKAGFDQHLLKPIEPGELQRMLMD
jgi:signal transduction histidine kinase